MKVNMDTSYNKIEIASCVIRGKYHPLTRKTSRIGNAYYAICDLDLWNYNLDQLLHAIQLIDSNSIVTFDASNINAVERVAIKPFLSAKSIDIDDSEQSVIIGRNDICNILRITDVLTGISYRVIVKGQGSFFDFGNLAMAHAKAFKLSNKVITYDLCSLHADEQRIVQDWYAKENPLEVVS